MEPPSNGEFSEKTEKAAVVRMVITLALVAGMYAMLIVYQNKRTITVKGRRIFNAVTTAILILLVINVFSSLGEATLNIRWYILSRRYRPVKQSTQKAVQIAYASMTLTYGMSSNWDMALLKPGKISIPELSNISTLNLVAPSNILHQGQQYLANRYGLISLTYGTAFMEDQPVPRQLWYSSDPAVFCQGDNSSFDDPNYGLISAVSNRSINASTNCDAWPIVWGGDGGNGNITFRTDDGDLEFSVPWQGFQNRATFLLDTERDCGPRCSVINVFESSFTSPWFYECNVTIGAVANVTREIEQVGPALAQLASQSIALRGYTYTFTSTNATTADDGDSDDELQYAVYPAETYIGQPQNGSTETMGLIISRFSVGVIAVAARDNDKISVDGHEPFVGAELTVSHWDWANAILILTAIAQVAMALVNFWVTRKVILPSNGIVDEARILRPMMVEEGLLRTSRARVLPKVKSTKPPSEWIYRNVPMGDGLFDLFLEMKVP
ncbi:unnamed protein product [Parascedosporium putredinis]|uniref:Uncharacterized protein n=1 Tax=Parascedosporium putredinis TaxID=1442378 RepID=A0A9P1H214_9PEZI|nr:unnamed protein product [Parascedosporium putredinis]CAI7993206.1 unnamed protein product [Parascedosporium putredinis]